MSFTSDQGLSNTCVHSITEDSYHNVWITTRNGLNMYDGAKFRTYYHNDQDSLSLIDDIVTAVTELVPGKVLVGTNSGLCYFDYSTDSFYSIPLINEEGRKVLPRVIDIYLCKDGTARVLVVGMTSYIVSLDGSNGVEARWSRDYVINGRGPAHFLEASDGASWFVTSGNEVGFVRNGKLQQVPLEGRALHLIEGVKGNIYVDVEGRGLYRYDEQSHGFVLLPLPELSHVVFKNLRTNDEGYLFICTDGNGLYLYNEKTGELESSRVRTTEYNIATANIEDAMQDKAGNLWIGIYWKGVVVQPHVANAFEYVGRRSGQKNTLGTNCVTSVRPAENGRVWVGTDHCGLYNLSADGSESVHYKPGEVKDVPETITTIYQDSAGILWLGSSIGGMVCMNPSTGVFTPFEQIHPEGAKVSKVYGIQSDNHGNLWIGTMGNGLFCYNPHTRQLNHYGSINRNAEDEINILLNVWINCLAVDGNHIYVGHSAGLDQFRINEDGRLELMASYLGAVSVNDVKVDDKGIIWAGTAKGLYRLRLFAKTEEVTRLTRQDGLSNNMVRSLELHYLTNGEYEVWASTDNGMNCYLPSAGTFRRFYIGDGLQGNEFTEHCSASTGDRLYFGGINGLNYFLPSEIIRTIDESRLQLRIVGLYLQGEVVKAGQRSDDYVIYDSWIDEVEELNFCHSDNNLAIELGTTSLSRNVVYEYSLEEEEWQSLGIGQNRIVLNNLSPGVYHLHIRALSNGKYSQERLLTIIIHGPWYLSVWMKLLYLLLLIALAYLIYINVRTHVRAKQMLNEKKQEEEIAEARMQFFMNISHEIRTPMTLILAPLEKLRAMNDDDEHKRHYNLIYQNAQRILQLINQMMDVRKIEKGQFQLDYQRLELVGFIYNLYELFETTSQRRNISLEYRHSMERLEVQVDIPSIDKIVMNLLSNALKFTSDGGHVIIELTKQPDADTFMLSVTDDGIGISGNDKERVFQRFYSGVHQNGYIGTGIGLNLTYLLVQLHKGKIDVKDNPAGKGTCFEVVLPCSNPDIAEQGAPAVAEELPVEKLTGKRHRNLLLVEDDVEIRHYLCSELSSDFSVIELGNGQDAWEMVQRNPDKVDIIITDIMMPLMGGDALCQKVKSNFNTSHIPVIMLSAKNTDSDRIAGMSIGADAYMTKPFNVNLLRTTALTILQNHLSLQSRAIAAQKTEEAIDNIEVVSPDEQLMERIMKCINENLSNPDLSVEFVADKVGVSRVHFHRKLKELAGQTPRDFIRNIRMKQAEKLLREKHLDITDVSIATGFKSLSTFSSTFKSIYGMTPTEYMNSKKNQ